MRCPKCDGPIFAAVEDEVDIGVGILKRITHGECGYCGEISYCDKCGGWNDSHSNLCGLLMGREEEEGKFYE